jgi:hypothetical protein
MPRLFFVATYRKNISYILPQNLVAKVVDYKICRNFCHKTLWQKLWESVAFVTKACGKSGGL